MLDGKVKGFFLLGENPAVGSAQREAPPARAGAARLARGARLLRRSRARPSGTTRPRSRPASCAPRTSAPRCSSCPRPRTPRRTGTFTNTQRLLQWHHKAVEPAGRLPLGAVVHVPPRAPHPREARRVAPSERDRPRARPDLGLPDRGRRTRSRAPRRCCGRSTACDADGAPLSGYTRAARRRLDRVRLLDLLRLLRRTASTRPRAASPAASRPGSRPSGAGRGRRTGACSTTAPRPTRPGGPGRSASATSGGTRSAGRWTGEDVPGLQGRHAARTTSRREDATGRGRAARRRAVHHAGRRARLAVRAQRRSSTARCPRTTSRTSRRSTTRSTRQRANPARQRVRAAREPVQPAARPADVFPYVMTTYRLTEHHTAGGDVAHPALPGRAPARDVLRGEPGAGAPSAASSTAAGRRSSRRARRSRRACWSPTACRR